MITHDPIYKIDSKGKTRVWYMERAENTHRTIAGIEGGNLVASEWTVCTGKQGRSDEAQAHFEVEAAYKKKLSGEYHRTIEDAAGGAHFFKPMLAEKYDGWPGQCFAQPKLDGARCIARVVDGVLGLYSREGKPWVSVPHIIDALRPQFAANPSLVLDGELYNHDLRDDFDEIMSLVRKTKPTFFDFEETAQKVQYHIYDVPSHPGVFSERNRELHQMFGDPQSWPSCLRYVETASVSSRQALDEFYTKWLADEYEGQIVRLDTPYENKRSKGLLKRKEFITAEYELVSIEPGNGNWSNAAKRTTCRLPDGRTFGTGIKCKRERAKTLLGETWSQATVRHFGFTPDGIPRFGVAIDFHNGRDD